MQGELKVIKKKYGENFAKLCRSLFPTLLEKEGKLLEILDKTFEPSHFLYEDLVKENCIDGFKDYIFSFCKEEEKEIVEVTETPEELFDKAGYKLYKCETNEDVLSFKKYYKIDEQLCTFGDPSRIVHYHIFWAVKKNVDEIKRENFINPQRQDEYGTSVISLQFRKGEFCTLSIKNRYNHTVNHPDATFGNNLDNIYPGLTASFVKYNNLTVNNRIKKFLDLNGYVRDNMGKFYKYNYEVCNVYYCPNNIVIKNFIAYKYDKNRYEVIDYFVLDKQEKTMFAAADIFDDSFLDIYQNIKKIEITKQENGNRKFEITSGEDEKSEIVVDKCNNMIEYTNNNLKRIYPSFLRHNTKLIKINIPNVERIGEDFLYCNRDLSQIDVENLKVAYNNFLYHNEQLTELNAPNLKNIGNRFLRNNTILKYFNAPSLEYIGEYVFMANKNLKEINLPNVEKIGDYFMTRNNSIKELECPKLKSMGKCCFVCNKNITKINAPTLITIGADSFDNIKFLNNSDLLKLETAPTRFINILNNGKNKTKVLEKEMIR